MFCRNSDCSKFCQKSFYNISSRSWNRNLDVVCEDPRLFLHPSEGENPLVAEVVEDGVVDHVDPGEVAADDHPEVQVVDDVVAVL